MDRATLSDARSARREHRSSALQERRGYRPPRLRAHAHEQPSFGRRCTGDAFACSSAADATRTNKIGLRRRSDTGIERTDAVSLCCAAELNGTRAVLIADGRDCDDCAMQELALSDTCVGCSQALHHNFVDCGAYDGADDTLRRALQLKCQRSSIQSAWLRPGDAGLIPAVDGISRAITVRYVWQRRQRLSRAIAAVPPGLANQVTSAAFNCFQVQKCKCANVFF